MSEYLELRSPMLAPTKVPDPPKLKYPMYASIKMDGVRCLIMNGSLISRSGKRLPNRQLHVRLKPLIQRCQERMLILDGEIWAPDVSFHGIISATTRVDNDSCNVIGLGFHAFDLLTYDEWLQKYSRPYKERYDQLRTRFGEGEHTPVVNQKIVNSAIELDTEYQTQLAAGHEGLIVRSIYGKYKWGRCTFNEQNMFKMKAVEEVDCEVIGYDQLQVMAPGTEREYDAFGRPKSINRQADRVCVECVGKLHVRAEDGREFSVGSGFTDTERYQLWDQRKTLVGRWCKVKYAVAGIKDLPRHPVFVSFRDPK